MNNLQVFNNKEFGEIRVTVQNGEPLFLAADVCRALEHSNVTMALDRLDEDEKAKLNLGLSGGATNCVTEAGLYSLVLGSRKPEARAFKRWVTHEVLPVIRKTGGYVNDSNKFVDFYFPQLNPTQKTAISMMLDESKRMGEQLQAQAPKVLFADSVSTAKTSILIGELAKLIKQNGVDIGQNRMFQFLRDNGYLISRAGSDYNMPTQYSMERGWFEIRETSFTPPDGSTHISKTTKVTGKGQQYFINLFLKEREIA